MSEHHTITVQSVITQLEEYYPPQLAASWDTIGLVAGQRRQKVTKILVCLDVNAQVVRRACENNYDMILAHHPLLFKGVTSVSQDTFWGWALSQLIQHNIALYTAHTNADSAIGGVADVLSGLLHLEKLVPLEPHDISSHYENWHVYVPSEQVKFLADLLAQAGAGTIGNYDYCSWHVEGTGRYRALEGAHPTLGALNEIHQEPEVRLEFIAPQSLRATLTHTIQTHHPYETPAFGITPWINPNPIQTGIGRMGYLPQPMTVLELGQRLQEILPPTQGGLRIAGDLTHMVHTVALCPGAGDSLLSTVRSLQPDVYITGDLRHHPVDDHLKAGGCAVIDAGHWASEILWCHSVCERISADIPELTVQVFDEPTEPWTHILA